MDSQMDAPYSMKEKETIESSSQTHGDREVFFTAQPRTAGGRPLHWAAANGHVEVVISLRGKALKSKVFLIEGSLEV